jgi:hypothetical protein
MLALPKKFVKVGIVDPTAPQLLSRFFSDVARVPHRRLFDTFDDDSTIPEYIWPILALLRCAVSEAASTMRGSPVDLVRLMA